MATMRIMHFDFSPALQIALLKVLVTKILLIMIICLLPWVSTKDPTKLDLITKLEPRCGLGV
jgi:hypothetical protein